MHTEKTRFLRNAGNIPCLTAELVEFEQPSHDPNPAPGQSSPLLHHRVYAPNVGNRDAEYMQSSRLMPKVALIAGVAMDYGWAVQIGCRIT